MKPVLLAAGGTGGHLFPAQALAEVLRARGMEVQLVTDTRAQKYSGAFPASQVHAVPSATPAGGGVMGKAWAALVLARGVLAARVLIREVQPSVVVGFGGYPTVPPLIAASQLKVPCLLHEQNAVMGRANRFLARRVGAIGTGFATLNGVDASIKAKAVDVGNPVRPSVIAASAMPYPAFEGRLKVLVTGGSQGAKVMSDIVPAAMQALGAQACQQIDLVQQARGEDVARVEAIYAQLGLNAKVQPFFDDLPGQMAQAHLVIARSGASTVSELAVIGRPAILVPFPFALDQDQAANAAEMAQSGAVEVVKQVDFTPQFLSEALLRALANPEDLQNRARAAKKAGRPDAAEKLADLVLRVAQG